MEGTITRASLAGLFGFVSLSCGARACKNSSTAASSSSMASPRNLRRNFAVGNSSPSLPVSETRERRFLAGLHRASALCVEGQSAQYVHWLFDWNCRIAPMELTIETDMICAKVAEGFVVLLQLGHGH
jgi:hypothetical protein